MRVSALRYGPTGLLRMIGPKQAVSPIKPAGLLRSHNSEPVPDVPIVQPLCSVQAVNEPRIVQRFYVQTYKDGFSRELPRFGNSRNVETKARYFARPRRRRSSPAEMEPSYFVRARERSMILRNLRLVLSATVSSSALRMRMTAANGLSRLMTRIGSLSRFFGILRQWSRSFFEPCTKKRGCLLRGGTFEASLFAGG